jgi:hypothetical protein
VNLNTQLDHDQDTVSPAAPPVGRS